MGRLRVFGNRLFHCLHIWCLTVGVVGAEGQLLHKMLLRSLKWIHSNLGFQFHTDDELVLEFRSVSCDHVERQVVPMPLAIWINICGASQPENDFERILAITWLGLIQGCLRYAHWQPSFRLSERRVCNDFQAHSWKTKSEGSQSRIRLDFAVGLL